MLPRLGDTSRTLKTQTSGELILLSSNLHLPRKPVRGSVRLILPANSGKSRKVLSGKSYPSHVMDMVKQIWPNNRDSSLRTPRHGEVCLRQILKATFLFPLPFSAHRGQAPRALTGKAKHLVQVWAKRPDLNIKGKSSYAKS